MTWNRLLLLFLLIALPTLASAAPTPLPDHQRGDAYAAVTCGVQASADVQIERASDPQLLPDLVPTVEDLELPGEVEWSRPHLYIGGLDGARRRPRRGKKRGGGLTKSQKLFQSAAKTCQKALREGELETRAGMSSCMRSELRDRGFRVKKK